MISNLILHFELRHWRAMRKQASEHASQVAIAMDHIPMGLRTYWNEHGPGEFKGMPTSNKAWAWSVRGLLTYFAMASQHKGQTLLPSRAADSVWHAWLAWDAEGLRRFQVQHFGREMEHVEKKDMLGKRTEGALARTWAFASNGENLPLLSGKVPFLFQVDGELNMPQGWAYSHSTRTKEIQVADIGRWGATSSVVPGITAAGFVALGLMSAQDAQAWQAKHAKEDSGSGGGCGVGMAGYSCGSGGSGSSDGGSSCGGGGCGD